MKDLSKMTSMASLMMVNGGFSLRLSSMRIKLAMDRQRDQAAELGPAGSQLVSAATAFAH